MTLNSYQFPHLRSDSTSEMILVNNLPSAMLGRTQPLQMAPELILAGFEPPWRLHLLPFSFLWGLHTHLTQSPGPFQR